MSHDKTLFDLVKHPLRVRRLEVKRVQALTPRMRRITLGGPELAGFVSLAPEDHVKVFFPRPGEALPVLPTIGPLGLPMPSFGAKPLARDYTPRRFDAETWELDIDFFLHGNGIAAKWAAQAIPGDVVGIAGPRGSFVLKRSLDWHFFVGDETSLPEFARRIEELPASTVVRVVAVVDGPDEEHPLSPRPTVRSHWIHRGSSFEETTRALVDALRATAIPDGDGFVWLAGEASQVRAVFHHLVRERSIPFSHVHTSGHWKRGVEAHDHHEPIPLDAPSASPAAIGER